MTILPSLLSAAFTLLLWFYIRNNLSRNFVRLFELHPKWILIFDFIFVYCGFFRFFYRVQNSALKNTFFNVSMNLSYVILGFLGLITFWFIFMDLRNLFDKIFHRKDQESVDHSRRAFFKQNLALTGIVSSSVITGVGYANSFDPKVKKVEITLPDEHKALHGLKIAQLSDIHIGPTLKKDFVEMIVSLVNNMNADLVVITGDMVDGRVEYLKEDLAPFLTLKSRLGTYFCTGNHEYYWYANEWIEWTKQSGLNPLINEHVKLSHNQTEFYLAGVNDPTSRRLDPENATDPFKAAKGMSKDAYKILLAHQPGTCFQAVKAGFHTQLSGHTHGGQGFPWNIIVYMVQPYIRGLNNHEGMNVYVHTGTGFWGPPNRFMVDSEIAEITFIHKNKGETA